MKYLKKFEGIKSEFPGMFAEDNYTPETVPGFEDGTIDPSDESDKDRYEDFKKIIIDRNIKEDNKTITINMKRLGEDFYMSIMNASKYLSEFLLELLIGKYIIKGYKDVLKHNQITGIISDISAFYDDYTAFVSLIINNKYFEYGICDKIIVIDKIKSEAGKFNL